MNKGQIQFNFKKFAISILYPYNWKVFGVPTDIEPWVGMKVYSVELPTTILFSKYTVCFRFLGFGIGVIWE